MKIDKRLILASFAVLFVGMLCAVLVRWSCLGIDQHQGTLHASISASKSENFDSNAKGKVRKYCSQTSFSYCN